MVVWFCPYIILRGNGPVKVCIEPRQLHENIFPNARNFAEKEEGSNAGRNTKIGRSSTAVRMLEKLLALKFCVRYCLLPSKESIRFNGKRERNTYYRLALIRFNPCQCAETVYL